MKKRLLVIGAGWEQRGLVERALQEGFDVAATGPAASEAAALVSTYAPIDARDLPRLLDFATSVNAQAVVSDQDDYARYAEAWLAERLRLTGPALEAVAPTTMKHWLRDLCRRAQIPQPAYRLIRSLDEGRAAARELPWPIIAKPVDNRGSFGVVRVDEPSQLDDAVADALAHSHSRAVLLEQFIEGTVVTVDGAYLPQGHQILGVASNRRVSGRRQVSMEMYYPAQIPKAAVAQATDVANSVAALLARRGATGLSHTELLFDGDNVWLVESANRGGGIHISDIIIPAYSGFDTNGFLLAEATGTGPAHWQFARNKTSVILSFIALTQGRIAALKGIDRVASSPGVLAARLNVAPGDVVDEVANGVSRAGFLIVAGTNLDEARKRVKAALHHLQVTYA